MKCLILLSGCGLGDGSAIEEVVLVYTALDKYDISYLPVAENRDFISLNHYTEESSDIRNILFESARIGRGLIKDIEKIDYDDYDALIIPGGVGLIKNYQDSNIVYDLVQNFLQKRKPIGTMCAGIDLLHRWLNPSLLKDEIRTLKADEFCCDSQNLIYYTPAFRKSSNISVIQEGIEKMILVINCELDE